MRNIARCYNEHAIKVTDSYCSGPSNNNHNQVYFSPPSLIPSVQDSVTCIYRVKSEKQFLIKITWCSQLEPGFSISISDKKSNKIDKVKGSTIIQCFSSTFNISWDLSSAVYEVGPEPINGYYIKVVANSGPVLILGDHNVEPFSGFSLVSRIERFSGSSVFSTRARFCETGMWHEISVRCTGEETKGFKNSGFTMSVSIDKKSVIQVKRLQWNFRGNQTIFLDGLVLDMLWDVHDWLFNNNTNGCAMFMFRTRSGLDSRLWLEEKNKLQQNEQEKVGFSLLICARKNPD